MSNKCEIQGSDSVILFKIRVVTSVRLRVQYQTQDYGGGFLLNILVVASVRPRVSIYIRVSHLRLFPYIPNVTRVRLRV